MKRMLPLLAIALAACAARPPDNTPPAICVAGKGCEMAWAAALEWVQTNSHWKLRIATDTVITTEGPFDTPFASYSITKRPLPDGRYLIDFRAGCGNIFGCVPDVSESHASFAKTLGVPPG